MVQTNDELAKLSLNWARQFIHLATEKLVKIEEHKGGYTTNYKNGLLSEYRDLIKESQQLLHYVVEKTPNLTQATSNPNVIRLKELNIIHAEPGEP